MTELLSVNGKFKCKASSTLNSSSQYASKNMFDESTDTCWNSDQGSPQFIFMDFLESTKFHSVEFIFQGGFVGQDIIVEVGDSPNSCSASEPIHDIYDINDTQKYVFPTALEGRYLKIIFNSSTDFYGRVTIYSLKIFGQRK